MSYAFVITGKDAAGEVRFLSDEPDFYPPDFYPSVYNPRTRRQGEHWLKPLTPTYSLTETAYRIEFAKGMDRSPGLYVAEKLLVGIRNGKPVLSFSKTAKLDAPYTQTLRNSIVTRNRTWEKDADRILTEMAEGSPYPKTGLILSEVPRFIYAQVLETVRRAQKDAAILLTFRDGGRLVRAIQSSCGAHIEMGSVSHTASDGGYGFILREEDGFLGLPKKEGIYFYTGDVVPGDDGIELHGHARPALASDLFNFGLTYETFENMTIGDDPNHPFVRTVNSELARMRALENALHWALNPQSGAGRETESAVAGPRP